MSDSQTTQLKRIQCKRTKGWRMPSNTVYVGSPTIFANPFIGNFPAYLYKRWLAGSINRRQFTLKARRPHILHHDRKRILDSLDRLRGKNLACCCKPDDYCHADVLLEVANGKT